MRSSQTRGLFLGALMTPFYPHDHFYLFNHGFTSNVLLNTQYVLLMVFNEEQNRVLPESCLHIQVGSA